METKEIGEALFRPRKEQRKKHSVTHSCQPSSSTFNARSLLEELCWGERRHFCREGGREEGGGRKKGAIHAAFHCVKRGGMH